MRQRLLDVSRRLAVVPPNWPLQRWTVDRARGIGQCCLQLVWMFGTGGEEICIVAGLVFGIFARPGLQGLLKARLQIPTT